MITVTLALTLMQSTPYWTLPPLAHQRPVEVVLDRASPLDDDGAPCALLRFIAVGRGSVHLHVWTEDDLGLLLAVRSRERNDWDIAEDDIGADEAALGWNVSPESEWIVRVSSLDAAELGTITCTITEQYDAPAPPDACGGLTEDATRAWSDAVAQAEEALLSGQGALALQALQRLAASPPSLDAPPERSDLQLADRAFRVANRSGATECEVLVTTWRLALSETYYDLHSLEVAEATLDAASARRIARRPDALETGIRALARLERHERAEPTRARVAIASELDRLGDPEGLTLIQSELRRSAPRRSALVQFELELTALKLLAEQEPVAALEGFTALRSRTPPIYRRNVELLTAFTVLRTGALAPARDAFARILTEEQGALDTLERFETLDALFTCQCNLGEYDAARRTLAQMSQSSALAGSPDLKLAVAAEVLKLALASSVAEDELRDALTSFEQDALFDAGELAAPIRIDAMIVRAEALESLGRRSESIATLESALTIRKDANLRFGAFAAIALAEMLNDEGEPARADDVLREEWARMLNARRRADGRPPVSMTLRSPFAHAIHDPVWRWELLKAFRHAPKSDGSTRTTSWATLADDEAILWVTRLEPCLGQPAEDQVLVARHTDVRVEATLRAEESDQALTAWRQQLEDPSARTPDAAELAALWTPILRRATVGVQRLYVVTDGPTTGIPWADLTERLVGRPIDVCVLDHPERRARTPAAAPGGPALIVGGIEFGSTPEADSDFATTRSGTARSFPPLPSSRREAKDIANLLDPVYDVTWLSGRDATESAVVQHASQAGMIHLATHGWFLHEALAQEWSPHALTRRHVDRWSAYERVARLQPARLCGLALHGANDADGRRWEGVPGLLTAYEIQHLDLRNCDLAVFSACDSHAGANRCGLDTATLAHSALRAGARRVIASLWRADDQATRSLFGAFYARRIARDETVCASLRAAQHHVREHPDHPEWVAPYYWAGWVVAGAPTAR